MYNDASAVQFTRNPDGIAGALKRIGGLKSGSKVVNPGAAEVSHAFFAQGVSGFMQSLAATHPPLKKRILRIDPHWDGKFDTSDKIESPRDKEEPVKKQTMTREQLAINATTLAAGAAMADVSNAIDQIGNPKPETINQARVLISGLPTVIKEAAHEPYGARAVIYSLVFDPEQEILGKQMAHLQLHADPDVFELTHKLLPDMNGLEIKYRLPIIDIAIPTLKQLSPAQYQVFRDNLVALIQMDSRVDLMEWLLQKILFNHLDGHFIKIARTNLHSTNIDQLKHEIELVLSIMAHSGDQSQNEIEGAFGAAAKILEISGLELVAKNTIRIPDLDQALKKLEMLKPMTKQKFLNACAASVFQDKKISAVEIELLRAISDVLGCPMPPIIY